MSSAQSSDSSKPDSTGVAGSTTKPRRAGAKVPLLDTIRRIPRWHSGGTETDPLADSSATATNPETLSGSDDVNDKRNYSLLVALYTLQGIPIGLSASIPFLIQQKIKTLSSLAAQAAATTATMESTSPAATVTSSVASTSAAQLSYNANAIFALCSWPFSLKLLWAPIVDAVFFRRLGRRKSWLVPVQALAGFLMVTRAGFVEEQLGLGTLMAETVQKGASAGGGSGSTASSGDSSSTMMGAASSEALATMNVKGVTAFFFVLYFLMATQDVAVDGWALTMLSKKNRGKGPVCNAIGQNIGYFLSFVGFLALNDVDSSEKIWRPLLGLPSKPGYPLVSLGGFIKFMGFFMLAVTTFVALFKSEAKPTVTTQEANNRNAFRRTPKEDEELDASEIGLKETYRRLWAVCQLPAVRWLFLILLTNRLPAALSDNVKFLKAVEFGISRSTIALLSPTLILPLSILVPLVASRWWRAHPLKQFMTAFNLRITLVPILDVIMLKVIQQGEAVSKHVYWVSIILSTAVQAISSTLAFNAQMMFFAQRVDPAIGGTYMTLLNTAANLGGTWPASAVMLMMGHFTKPPSGCSRDDTVGAQEVCSVPGRDGYVPLQVVLSVIGIAWAWILGPRVQQIAALPDEAWRTRTSSDSKGKRGGTVDESQTLAPALLSNDTKTDEGGWNGKQDPKRE